MKLKIVDYLKGYSIFTIVIFHLLQFFPLQGFGAKLISFGGAGIHVFILCSGFGLYLSQLKKPLKYIEFIKKRFLKIYIPYIIIVLITALFPSLYEHSDRITAIFSHVFLFKMFNERWMTSLGYQFWFISTILQFYLLFPILINFVKRFQWKSVLISVVISLLWSTIVAIIGESDNRIWNSFFIQYLWQFVLGMMIAVKYKENPDFIKIPSVKYLLISLVLGLTLVGYTGIKGGILKLYNDIPSLMGYLSLALLLYLLGNHLKWIHSIFIYINKYSYEWYLVHMLVFIIVFNSISSYVGIPISGALALIISFLLGILYHRLLQKYLFSKIG